MIQSIQVVMIVSLTGAALMLFAIGLVGLIRRLS
jgi:hypothetical protein